MICDLESLSIGARLRRNVGRDHQKCTAIRRSRVRVSVSPHHSWAQNPSRFVDSSACKTQVRAQLYDSHVAALPNRQYSCLRGCFIDPKKLVDERQCSQVAIPFLWMVYLMDLLLLPHSSKTELADVYRRALRSSTHLYIVSAYLTHWDIDEDLGKQCETFTFIVGKDFGITRIAACKQVLKWLPTKWHEEFLVAEGIVGFHPKAVFWRELDGSCYALVGSSNLSRAAFSSNHEANGYSPISKRTFRAAEKWIENLASKCTTLDANWLAGYQEAKQPPKPKRQGRHDQDDDGAVFELTLPNPRTLSQLSQVLDRRRAQMRQFTRIRSDLEKAFQAAAAKKNWRESDNNRFYDHLNDLWSHHRGNRFQGAGWERQGKNSNFQELAISVVRVLKATEISRDRVVMLEIDRLDSIGITTRGALFSEMLCQFFPKRYYVLNSPIREWLGGTGVDTVRGASQGANYIRSARLLRVALSRAKTYPAKNLAELDAVIWRQRNPNAAI